MHHPIPLPTKIEYRKGSKPNETDVVIEPLYPGYGLTIGTALRRVLLSSLEGGAVVAVKIKGMHHEFSTLPYVKEDAVDILLNIKKLRFTLHTSETVRLFVRAKGEKFVTGADIEKNPDVSVANPERPLCTITNKSGQVEMELFVRKGQGYLPTEGREKKEQEIGAIALDAIFTPIRKVGLHVEDVRVGQMTNYNRVVLTIETDGSLSAQDAMHQATQILVGHFQLFLHAQPDSASSVVSHEDLEDVRAVFQSETTAVDQASDTQNEEGDRELAKEPKKRGRPKKKE